MGCSTCGKGPRLTPVDPHAPKVETGANIKRYKLRPLRSRQMGFSNEVPKPAAAEEPIARMMEEKGADLGDTKPPGISSVEKEDIET